MSEFLIADSFADSLGRLGGDSQKAAKTAAFDLQLNPAHPGFQFHRLDKAKDKSLWSVRVNADLRIIVHRSEGRLLLCYVGHHDDAYRWAESRKIERHPTTGAAQLVELRESVREVVREVVVPRLVEAPSEPAAQVPKLPLFRDVPRDELLAYGVPAEWVGEVTEATEESLLQLAEHLPGEAAEALLDLATGGRPVRPVQAPAGADPFAHPDAQRRFRLMANVEELERALEYPWEKWMVFLHPTQREIVEKSYGGPARVAGSAGTGKTIVALHRAVHLARSRPEARVLLATFSEPLAGALHLRLRRLIGKETRLAERLEVQSLGAVARRLYEANFGAPHLAGAEEIRRFLREAAGRIEGHRFRPEFLFAEWTAVVDAWQIESWEQYRDVQRLGRKTRLAETQRSVLWSIFSLVRDRLEAGGLSTEPGLFRRLERHLAKAKRPPFDFAVIDEAQDLGVAELRFLAALGGDRPDSLFFAGDLGQRIFQTPFSWRSLGVDVRGRSQTLRINYRTSHQIRRQADRLLPAELADVDGNTEERRRTLSAFNGPEPAVERFGSAAAESAAIAAWLRARIGEGYAPQEIGIFVRSEAELERAGAAVRAAGLRPLELDRQHGGQASGAAGAVAVGTMHLAKGLEYRAVIVAACDDEVLPLQSRIESVTDEADLEDVYDTERHLLYVACTRARDRLLVTGVEPGSEFLEDLRTGPTA
ncbi:MAG: UvrD-helicase domain-containing protein [Holophagales bacterium]|nr:MAG: UvrD-helicase domain-containing protein [Holophagales bacterium]